MSAKTLSPEQETMDMPEACRILSISQVHGYNMAAEGTFPCRTLRLGRRVKVMRREFEQLIRGKPRSSDRLPT